MLSLDKESSLIDSNGHCSAVRFFIHRQTMKSESIQRDQNLESRWYFESTVEYRESFGFFFSFLSYPWFLDRWAG
jgi:hypothetical protein